MTTLPDTTVAPTINELACCAGAAAENLAVYTTSLIVSDLCERAALMNTTGNTTGMQLVGLKERHQSKDCNTQKMPQQLEPYILLEVTKPTKKCILMKEQKKAATTSTIGMRYGQQKT